MTRVAVVDIGTNSTRLLIADVDPRTSQLTPISRRSTVTRLGAGVEQTGVLSGAAMQRVFEALDLYAVEIGGADVVDHRVAVLTSAVRDAANGADFTARVKHDYGLDARTIPGELEARLSYRGATSGRAPSPEPVVVVDIGGGSTEIIIGQDDVVLFHHSTQVGVVRHTERHIHHDPALPDELAALAADARPVFADAVPPALTARATRMIAVAGTATSLSAISQELEPYDAARVHGSHLTIAEIERMRDDLAAMPNARRRAVPGLHPDRAPTIVAGAVLLHELMDLFGVAEIEVSERDILHGVALAEAGSQSVSADA